MFLIAAALAIGFVYLFVEEKTLIEPIPILYNEDELLPTTAQIWDGEVDSVGIVFDYTHTITRVMLSDSTGILTIYDPAITVVWDTLTWREK